MALWMLNVTTVRGTDSPTRWHGVMVVPGTTTGGGPVGGNGAVLLADATVSVGRRGLSDGSATGPAGSCVGSPPSSATARSSATRTPVASSATSPWVRRLMGSL